MFQYDGKYIVVYLLGGFDSEADWEAFDTLEEAQERYKEILDDESLVCAHVTKSLESTEE